MSRLLYPFFAFSLLAVPTSAQQVYGPVDPSAQPSSDESADIPLLEANPCDETVQEDGIIVVCRELPETERYRSPLPKPVESDRPIIPGLTDPPCWVVPRGGTCIRFGSVPEPAIMVDLTAFPEPLSDEEASAVSETQEDAAAQAEPNAVDAEGASTVPPLRRRRIPIDISEDD